MTFTAISKGLGADMMPPGGATRYRPDIDGLRSVPILLVLVFHFDLFDLGKAGFLGVDVFFVISGYLISGLIWRGLESGTFSLGTFYLRRFRRLAPALLVTQAAVMVVALIMFMPHELISVAKENLATSLYTSNFYYWRNVNYFGLQVSDSILLHTWSLAVEEQFYIVFPILLLVVHRLARRHFFAVLVALTIASFLANLALVGIKPWATFYLLPTRAWELGIGALTLFAEPLFSRTRLLRLAAAMGGPLLVGLGVILFTHDTVFPGTFALLPTLGTALMILAGSGDGSPLSRMFATALPVAIGQVSYSLYLVHWPLRTIGQKLLVNYGLVERWSLFALSFVIAVLIYRTIENPVRTGKAIVTPRRFVVVVASGVAIMLAVSVSALVSHGWPQRFDARAVTLAAADADLNPQELSWENENKAASAANYRAVGETAQAPRWLIIGDSHAMALSGAVDQWLNRRHQSGRIGFRHGCLPILDTGDAACRAFSAAVHSQIVANGPIRDVLIISLWNEAFDDAVLRNHDTASLSYKRQLATFEHNLRRTLESFQAKGVRVHIFEPVPYALRPAPAALGRNVAFGSHWPVAQRSADHRATTAFLTQILDRNSALIVSRTRPADVMCQGERCMVTHDGRSLYSDNNHPAWGASTFFANILDRSIPAR